MKITSISRQKRKDRYNIFIDDEFSFGVYEDTLLKFSIASGDEIDDSKIELIKDTDEFNHGKKSAFRLLSYRQRSRKEIERKLKEKKISQKNIERIINFLEEKKFINDDEFAKAFYEYIIIRKPVGKKVIVNKLKEKGIDNAIIDNIISEKIDAESEMNSAITLINKYSRKIDGHDKYEKKKKVYQYLHSKGFEYETINKVWTELFK
jgi:regulatory protein